MRFKINKGEDIGSDHELFFAIYNKISDKNNCAKDNYIIDVYITKSSKDTNLITNNLNEIEKAKKRMEFHSKKFHETYKKIMKGLHS